MKLDERKDMIVDALLREWGRWRRMEMTHAGAPRKHPQGSSWHQLMKRKQSDGKDVSDADYVDPQPDEEMCIAIHRAYERIKDQRTGYHVVLRDYYVDGTGWPPPKLLRHARYLIWMNGG